MTQRINTYNEGSLHAALKLRYAGATGLLETSVDGYIIDVVRDDLLIEIQTTSFSSAKRKLTSLAATHPLLLVHPIPARTWIVKRPEDPGAKPSRRLSPKRGSLLTLFDQLVSFPTLIAEPNFSIEVVLTHEDQLRHREPGRAWRRKGWVIDDRVLLEVIEVRRFERPGDLLGLLPDPLPVEFTTADLAELLRIPRRLAQRMAYCLRELGLIEATSRRQRSVVYRRAQ